MRLICPKEAATLLGVSVRTAQRLMRQGEIAACKIGKLWRTQAEDVAAYRARAYERYRRERRT